MATSKSYIPSFLKAALSGSRPIQLTYSDVKDTNISSTSSFIYDPSGSPLKSTQQLNVDWSKFQNHTFFMSAEAKVNLSFDQLINGYPFDGTRLEVEKFFEKLTGFDKWVFDQFPKYRGELHFSGTQILEDTNGTAGTWIAVKDAAGSLFPELAKNATGGSVLNPQDSSMTVEMHLLLPEQANDTQFIFQKLSGSTEGFALYLLPSLSTSSCDARFSVVSGSFSISTTATLTKGVFNHIAVSLNRDTGANFLQFFNAGNIVDTSRSRYAINTMNIDSSDFLIGTGSLMRLGTTLVSASQTLSGTIDEFRVFHSARSTAQLQQYARKPVFSTDDLKLYFRFNEPPPLLATSLTDTVNGIVIDSSGNSLHALINNFTGSLRIDAGTDPKSRMVYELDQTAPVLFPAHSGVINLNTELLTSASEYDHSNPNLITRLIPQHYLLDGAAFEGFEELEGNGGAPYGGSGIPGNGEKGNVQLLLSFLYIYAKYFDELKLYIDSFSTLRYVNYDSTDTIPDTFLSNLVQQFGFNLPPLFNDSTIEQYVRAENVDYDVTVNENSLRDVQNQLLRRVLINMPDVLKSKGTQHSIRSFLRAVGIDPDNSMRIREYGGPTTRQLSFSRETKRETSLMAKFVTSSYAISPFLSASRVEPGYPKIRGTFVSSSVYSPFGISNQRSDGLLTSGSWTVETIVKWTPAQRSAHLAATQSLIRVAVTGSTPDSEGIVANLVAISSSVDPRLVLYVRPGSSGSSPVMQVSLPTPISRGLFDGERWNVSFGCERNDSIDSRVSSSYFLRVATQSDGNIELYRSTSSFFYELSPGDTNVLRDFHSSSVSGPFLIVGEGRPITTGGTTSPFLNNPSVIDSESRTTNFTGMMSNLRLWSKALTQDEWKEHVRNYKSLGVENPLVNYNFVSTRSGSFERVRMDTLTKQEDRTASSSLGSLNFLDFSLNGMHLTGSGFPIDSETLLGELFDYSYVSPYFDEAATNEKIRARGFLNQDIIDETPWASVAPVYEIVKSEEPTDDVRLSIEFSLVDALNRDIVTLFATLDAIDNAIGAPELLFSPDYPDLDKLRNVYFNRISQKLNFKAFFEFFRWFDTSVSTFINQLIPRKTNFKGTNFIIESHMLERHKLEYLGNEIYLGDSDRSRITDVLLLQQIAGALRKY
jgi:hypothetical protein